MATHPSLERLGRFVEPFDAAAHFARERHGVAVEPVEVEETGAASVHQHLLRRELDATAVLASHLFSGGGEMSFFAHVDSTGIVACPERARYYTFAEHFSIDPAHSVIVVDI